MPRKLHPPWFSHWLTLAFLALLGTGHASHAWAQAGKPRLSLEQIGSLTATELAKRKGYQSGDLITQSDVKAVLQTLSQAGWKPLDQEEILALALPDDDALVRILATGNGQRFMRQSAHDELIYDRMDRVCRVHGGQRMLADMTKLPDGYKLAELKRPDGVPGFLDLLPKTASGKRRSIKHYEEPTGRIYNQQQLVKRLEASYQEKTGASAEKSVNSAARKTAK